MGAKRKYLLLAILVVALAMAAIFYLSNKSDGSSKDILSQKVSDESRTQITVLVKYAFSINGFEQAVEEKFPDIDIVQVGNYTHDMGIDEYAARLEHGDLTDIVMTWPLEVGEEYWADRLLDLSSLDFTNQYNLSMLNNISRDGKLYYLPGPSQVRGIVYNKTLFEENHWQVPEDFDGFVALCQEIEKTGMKSLQLGLKNGEVLDTAFFGYSVADCLSKPRDTQWLAEYDAGMHSFGDHFSPALDTFQSLIDHGILKKNDLQIDYSAREQMLFNRQCAMVEDSVLMARMGNKLTGSTDEFALMPFFNPNDGEDWARLYMVCYIGLNKELAQPHNQDKYDLVMKLMDYISTEEGQVALMSDTGAMFSSVTGIGAPEDVPEINAMLAALQSGRFAIFPQLKNAQSALREGLAGMVRGELKKGDVIKMVDAQNVNPPEVSIDKVIGTASSDFSVLETGNYVTDVMRTYSNSDIALFLDNGKDGLYNGKGISARLYHGELTARDIGRIMPDLKLGEAGELWKIEMTGASLINALEYALPIDNSKNNWFYYFSGLEVTFDPTAPSGSRIQKITDEKGDKIDPERLYTVAIMDQSVNNDYIQSVEKLDVKIYDLLISDIEQKQTIAPSLDGRFQVVNS